MKLFNVKRAVIVFVISALVLTAFLSPATGPATFQKVVVQGTDFNQVVQLVTSAGGEISAQYPSLDAVAATLSTRSIQWLANADGILAVTKPYQASLTGLAEDTVESPHIPETFYPEVVGADAVWQQGITGEGVTVAILDSGLHPFESLLKDSEGNNRLLAWQDFVDGSLTPIDPQGHGTHIAGIIANSQLGYDGEVNGVAPDVNLVAIRILDENGFGELENILAGLDWVLQHHQEYNIKVLNLSLSANIIAPYWADPINHAVMMAWAEGITVITSAGNQGSEALTVGVPGNNPYVVTVGTFTDHYTPADPTDDYMAYFSGAGPTRDGFIKPDVIAPGAHMASLMPADNTLFLAGEATQFSGDYYRMAGTSQSAAVVSGIAALMMQNDPSLTPDEVKYRLTNTANPMVVEDKEAAYSIFQQGYGRVNAVDAVFANITGVANQGLNITKDLAGTRHYHGMAAYNENTGTYLVRRAPAGGEAYFTWNGEFEQISAGFGSWADGFGSWADGFGSWADGFGSWADGFGSWADGFGSWADGFGSWADGFGSWADGFGSWADGFGSWADGFGSWADGFGSWADGFGSWADGFGSWADGFGSWADGFGSWADGFSSWADGFGSWADGFGSWADGFGSWADGFGSWADGFGSWADGFGSWADGFGSWADGFGSWADGFGSWADGFGSWADGFGSWADGFGSWADGFGSWADGFGSWADGFGSWADGFGSWADGFGSWADGFGSWADGFGSWADGFGSWADGFGSWADGFGSWADGFGSWADGFGSWADGFGSWADGFGSWADGFGSWADGFGSWADGFGSWADGFGSWADGYGSWADGFGSWADGFGSWADGFGSWADGFGSWADGFGSWADGFGSWADGFGSWADGFGSWADGFGSWADGFGSWADGFGSWAD